MNDTGHHDTAAQRVRAFIDGLDRDGAAPFNAGDSRQDFRYFAVTDI